MKLLLSSHKDKVYYPYQLQYHNGVHMGLLDNEIGVIATYLAVYGNESILELSNKGEIGIFHGDHEEFGMAFDFPVLPKDTKVIVIDVASGDQYTGKDFSVENISGFSKKEIKDLKEMLEWEGYSVLVKEFDGNPDDEDESWEWKKKGQRVVSFIIPISAKDDGWHRIQGDNEIHSDKLKKAVQGLQRVINFLL